MNLSLRGQLVLQCLCLIAQGLVAEHLLPEYWSKVLAVILSSVQMTLGLYGHTRNTDGSSMNGANKKEN